MIEITLLEKITYLKYFPLKNDLLNEMDAYEIA